MTALSSNDGEFETSTTTDAPWRTSASPCPVSVLTPVSGEAGTASWPCSRSLVTSFDPMSPVPPMMTSFMIDLRFCVQPMPESVDGCQKGRTFVLDEEHEEPGRRSLARVSANGVHVVRALIESLARPQCDGRPVFHLHDDIALQDVDERLRMMRVHRVDASRRVVDCDHRQFSGRISRELPR